MLITQVAHTESCWRGVKWPTFQRFCLRGQGMMLEPDISVTVASSHRLSNSVRRFRDPLPPSSAINVSVRRFRGCPCLPSPGVVVCLLWDRSRTLNITEMKYMLPVHYVFDISKGNHRWFLYSLDTGLLDFFKYRKIIATSSLDKGFRGFPLSSSKCWDCPHLLSCCCVLLMQTPSPRHLN
jgi:hypothetical protein